MHRLALLAALAALISLPVSARTTYNSSRGNTVYRVTYPSTLATAAQMKDLLAGLDKLGAIDEAALRQWLTGNFARYGVDAKRIRKIVIVPPRDGKEILILLLADPADEAMASTVKSSKSNSSE